jgi:hypothetical protein
MGALKRSTVVRASGESESLPYEGILWDILVISYGKFIYAYEGPSIVKMWI